MNLKIQAISKIIKEYDFDIDLKNLNDLQCCLCNNLLIDGRQTPCGCKFCCNCITEYISKEQKKCPGNTDDCKDVILNLKSNVVTDYSTNKKVAKLVVNCPLNQCPFRCELENMEQHLRVCNERPSECPYVAVGCNEFEISTSNITNHLETFTIGHAKLLIETVENLKNELIATTNKHKKALENIQLENEFLKSELKKIQTSSNKLERDVQKMNSDFNKKLNMLKQDQCQIEEKWKTHENKHTGGKVKSENEESQHHDCCERILKMDKWINELSKKNGELVWKINLDSIDLGNESGQCIFSDAFYSSMNGYKFQLVLKPGGCWDRKGSGISINCNMLIAQNDASLNWPVTFSVSIGLVNYETEECHKNDTRLIVYEKSPFEPCVTFKFRSTELEHCVHKDNYLIIKCWLSIM